jgi:hypothetical protein
MHFFVHLTIRRIECMHFCMHLTIHRIECMHYYAHLTIRRIECIHLYVHLTIRRIEYMHSSYLAYIERYAHTHKHILFVFDSTKPETVTCLRHCDVSPQRSMTTSIVVIEACHLRTDACWGENQVVVPSLRVCPNDCSTKKATHRSKCVYASCVWILP